MRRVALTAMGVLGLLIGSAPDTYAATPPPADFDLDQRSDVPLYNVATGRWKILESGGGTFNSVLTIDWGGPLQRPVLGDFDGDGRIDAAVYCESTGVWSVLRSSTGYTNAFSVAWGGVGYIPVPGDYDGDGVTDIAVYNPTTSYWYVLTSSTLYAGSLSISGAASAASSGQDFDGDRRCLVVTANRRARTVATECRTTSHGIRKKTFGLANDIVPGDYDGDGVADFGVYSARASDRSVLTSSTGLRSIRSAFPQLGAVETYGTRATTTAITKIDFVCDRVHLVAYRAVGLIYSFDDNQRGLARRATFRSRRPCCLS